MKGIPAYDADGVRISDSSQSYTVIRSGRSASSIVANQVQTLLTRKENAQEYVTRAENHNYSHPEDPTTAEQLAHKDVISSIYGSGYSFGTKIVVEENEEG